MAFFGRHNILERFLRATITKHFKVASNLRYRISRSDAIRGASDFVIKVYSYTPQEQNREATTKGAEREVLSSLHLF